MSGKVLRLKYYEVSSETITKCCFKETDFKSLRMKAPQRVKNGMKQNLLRRNDFKLGKSN